MVVVEEYEAENSGRPFVMINSPENSRKVPPSRYRVTLRSEEMGMVLLMLQLLVNYIKNIGDYR